MLDICKHVLFQYAIIKTRGFRFLKRVFENPATYRATRHLQEQGVALYVPADRSFKNKMAQVRDLVRDTTGHSMAPLDAMLEQEVDLYIGCRKHRTGYLPLLTLAYPGPESQ